ncbi:zinc transporter ZIP3-like [Amphibalanus amphitrite]|uniref:zinc transporter ZIP3-like n=1 Tax=Amphibalanus amphitrite TaxID=1232801 RepID=UPI001C91EF1D|nr:zinc transporter ZIP3-like [Amphibalanus amphitrite]
MEVYVAQILGITAIFFITTTIGVTPGILLRRNSKSLDTNSPGFRLMVSVANSLASGVFLDLCFLGLIPMVQDLFNKVWQELETEVHYPVGEAIVLCGFFMILTAENFAIWLQSRQPKGKSSGLRALSMDDIAEVASQVPSRRDSLQESAETRPEKQALNGVELQQVAVTAAPEEDGAAHGHSHGAMFEAEHSGLRFLMLLAAISLHSLFEGMAIGLQVSLSTLLNLLLAILIHESLVALAIGVKIAQQGASFWRSVKLICTFTLMIPVGIGLGIAVGTATGLIGNAISGTFQALAAGVFLHVTFMELVPDELEHSRNAFVSIACMFLGFAGMSLIVYLTEG